MNPERLAVAALHGVDPGKVRGGGDIPEFTAEDVAGAMGMGHLSRLQSELLYVSYCGYPRHQLWSLTLLEIEQWHPEWFGEKRLDAVVRAALEVVAPPDRLPGVAVPRGKCGACGGTGTDWHDPKRTPCVPCKGLGVAVLPWFGRLWSARLDELIGYLQLLESEALDHMSG